MAQKKIFQTIMHHLKQLVINSVQGSRAWLKQLSHDIKAFCQRTWTSIKESAHRGWKLFLSFLDRVKWRLEQAERIIIRMAKLPFKIIWFFLRHYVLTGLLVGAVAIAFNWQDCKGFFQFLGHIALIIILCLIGLWILIWLAEKAGVQKPTDDEIV